MTYSLGTNGAIYGWLAINGVAWAPFTYASEAYFSGLAHSANTFSPICHARQLMSVCVCAGSVVVQLYQGDTISTYISSGTTVGNSANEQWIQIAQIQEGIVLSLAPALVAHS